VLVAHGGPPWQRGPDNGGYSGADDDAHPDFTGLADDLSAAWKAPRTTIRTRQRLVRALIAEIVVDIDAGLVRSFWSSTGRAACIPSCASTSREQANTDAAHPNRRSPLCAVWRADGPIRTLPHH
jgi:hypothetical protein